MDLSGQWLSHKVYLREGYYFSRVEDTYLPVLSLLRLGENRRSKGLKT